MSLLTIKREQLIEDLRKIGMNYNEIIKNDNTMNSIGCDYQQRQQYHKAMSLFRMAAVKNNARAQNNLGYLYEHGYGVPQDYLLAIEWYLKAAIQGFKIAWMNIGDSLENGKGVPVDVYKAFEWYHKCGTILTDNAAFTKQRIQVTDQDKNKSIKELILETEDIVNTERNKKDDEISRLKQLKTKMEEEIQSLKKMIS